MFNQIKIKIAVFIILGLSFLILLSGSTTLSVLFPVQNHTCDDFSDPFGPRYKADDSIDLYDFHAGIDIGRYDAADLVLAYDYVELLEINGHQIVLRYADSEWQEFVQYNHVNPNTFAYNNVGNFISRGDVIASIQASAAHLDFRYFPNTNSEGEQDEYASHPGEVLGGFEGEQSGPTFIVNDTDLSQGTEVILRTNEL